MGFRWTGDFIGHQIEPNKAKFLENSLQVYAFLDLLFALRNNRATIMSVLRSPLGVTYL